MPRIMIMLTAAILSAARVSGVGQAALAAALPASAAGLAGDSSGHVVLSGSPGNPAVNPGTATLDPGGG